MKFEATSEDNGDYSDVLLDNKNLDNFNMYVPWTSISTDTINYSPMFWLNVT